MNFVRFAVVLHVVFVVLIAVALSDTTKPDVSSSHLPVFEASSWNFKMIDEVPAVEMIDGIEHITYKNGTVITLVRK